MRSPPKHELIKVSHPAPVLAGAWLISQATVPWLRQRPQFLRQFYCLTTEWFRNRTSTYNNITHDATTAILNLLCKTSPFKAASSIEGRYLSTSYNNIT